jgi:tetratricopeptide (TPR) repeat protein
MRMLIRTFIISIIVLVLFTPALCTQTNNNEPDIRHRLEMIEKGQAEAVRAELPSLMTNYQNNPGVMYLQAVLTTDGTEAAKLYQNIVDNFPKSEWGDDALYKLYQYYYSIGLYKTADQKLTQLKEEYPFSAYAAEKDSIVEEKQAVKEKPMVMKPKGTVPKFATNFTVQVGAFSTLENASELKAKFEKEGFQSNIFTIVSHGKKLHKVWVGEFQTYDEARRFTVEIKSKFNLTSIVVSR